VIPVADTKSGRDDLAQLGRVLRRFESTVDPAKLRLAVLALVFLRAYDQAGWAAARSSDRAFSELLRKLPHDLDIEIPDELLDFRHGRAALMDALEPIDNRAVAAEVFQQLLEEFAALSGRRGGMEYTPQSITAVMAGALDLATASTIFDPFCRSGELLVTAAADAPPREVSVHGATPGAGSFAMARMNTLLHGVQADLSGQQVSESGLSYQADCKFSRVLTNPPFNLRHWAEHDRYYWRYGPPPEGNANFAWLQYAVERLESGGHAAVIMPNIAMSSSSPRERRIRQGLVEDGCVEALISLPRGLFYHTGVPVTIWALAPPGTKRREVLFIDASAAGHLVDRMHRELSGTETSEIVDLLVAWRSGQTSRHSGDGVRAVSAPLAEIREREYNLSPHIYLSEPPVVYSSEAELLTVRHLLAQLETQRTEAAAADDAVMRVLRGLLG
jgi:type I restriction enzyme M protein